MKKILLILFIPLIFSSCYVHRISHGNGPIEGFIKKDKQHNFLFGIISETSPVIDGAISILTFGLYVPTTVVVKK